LQIGAGIDSFFEYAFKSYILLSSGERPDFDPQSPWSILDDYYLPLSEEEHSAEAFLRVWQDSHASVKRHLYRGSGYQHPHFVQGDIYTGATRAFWIDSLSAYYPGLLTLAGDLDQAIEIHLLATAVWTRFSALPERWNVATGNVEGDLGWWGGRPEFIESTYYLYRATKDPWYLHVGEMVLRDIKRRCWTKCGWAGLQDVRNGELSDRMESFFLGETAKYMFLLYDPGHPLNNIDAPFVFSTEGHPLIIPKSANTAARPRKKREKSGGIQVEVEVGMCQLPPVPPPFSQSSTAARPDIFHAASLARLHLMPKRDEVEGALLEYASDHPSVTLSDLSSPSNYTFYPWTLPLELVPFNATSAPMAIRPTLDISFPTLPSMILGPGALERVRDGILIKAIGGLRLGMIQDVPLDDAASSPYMEGFRIQVINNLPLGKDEKVYLSREITFDVLNPADPNFTRIRDPIMLDIVIDVNPELLRQRQRNDTADADAPRGDPAAAAAAAEHEREHHRSRSPVIHEHHRSSSPSAAPDDKVGTPATAAAAAAAYPHSHSSTMRTALTTLMNHVSSMLRETPQPSEPKPKQSRPKSSSSSSSSSSIVRLSLPAITPIGLGSAPLPDVEEASIFTYSGKPSTDRLSWSTVYLSDETCDHRLPLHVVRNHQVVVIKRGGCSFSQKLRNIPAFPPSRSALQLVVVVSYEGPDDAAGHSQHNQHQHAFSYTSLSSSSSGFGSQPPLPLAALAAEPYLIRPHLDEAQVTAGGIPRHRPLSMVMVGGGEETYELFRAAAGVGIKRRYRIRSQGVPISNLYII